MTDRDFDKLMEEALPELPPDDVVAEITPWRRAMGYIIGGSGLCSITLNFLNLNLLLPLIGVLCQLLGFRALRRENRWFGLCWWCAAIRWTSAAATTAQPAGKTQWMALKVLQAYSVFGPMPPLPTMTFTPVCSTNSFSNFSIRIEVVGPTETIS